MKLICSFCTEEVTICDNCKDEFKEPVKIYCVPELKKHYDCDECLIENLCNIGNVLEAKK